MRIRPLRPVSRLRTGRAAAAWRYHGSRALPAPLVRLQW